MKNKKKTIIILLIAIIVTIIAGTIAYHMVLNSRKNTFEQGFIKTEIIENFNSGNNIKENVLIKNTGNTPMYVRASILYLFENSDGQILDEKPVKDTDYTINFSSSSNWILSNDGYYYYKLPIEPGSNTDILIDNCKQIKEYDNKTFIVDIIVQGIQSNPSKAVIDAWGVDVKDDKITIE